MTRYEFLSIICSLIAIVISLYSFRRSSAIAMGSLELQINERIGSTKRSVSDASRDMIPIISKEDLSEYEQKQLEAYAKIYNTAIEENLNAYENACEKYRDKKVDRTRFKKTFFTEIRQLVENPEYEEYFHHHKSRYKATLAVYEEWFNLEK